MARNGSQKAKTEPNDLYDSLNQEGQDIWDQIGETGYIPGKGPGGLWFARKPGTDIKEAVGPSDSLHVLLSMVKDMPVSDPDSLGDVIDPDFESSRLPGMEEPAIEELDRLGDICISAKEEKETAKTEFDNQCDIMRLRMRDLGRKRYSRRGFILTIQDTEKLVIKKAEQPKSPKNPKKGRKPEMFLV